jgi:hypothetical protein
MAGGGEWTPNLEVAASGGGCVIASNFIRAAKAAACGLTGCLMIAGIARAQVCDQTARQPRPIEMGVAGGAINSILLSHHQLSCFGGTFGSLVEDANGQYILSNNHVLARQNAAKKGERQVQPGLEDLNCARAGGNSVATLSRFVRLTFRASKENTVDAAIALVNPDDVVASIKNIGAIDSVIKSSPLGIDVMKMGRTTCLTSGTVTAVNVNVTVDYSETSPGTRLANFIGQHLIAGDSGVSAPGDSGSLIVTDTTCPQPVGLLFAGSSSATIANPAAAVADALSVSWVGTCSSVRSGASVSDATPAASMPAAVTSATAVRDAHAAELMKIPGAIGTGIGIGDAVGQAAIIVLVKSDSAQARAAAPSSVGGTPVRLFETGTIFAY